MNELHSNSKLLSLICCKADKVNLCTQLARFFTTGTFHANRDTTKDRNGMDLTEAEDIKKRWQEYTDLYKKTILMTWLTTMV